MTEPERIITRFKVTTYPWNPNSLADCSFLDSYLVEAIYPTDSTHECLGKYSECGKVELLRRLRGHYQVVESELVFV